ncbi:MAG: hypothetical protein ABJA18_13365 [bacterium]
MILKLGQILLVLLLLTTGVGAAPNIVQSVVVDFPVNGRVIVQAHEEVGQFPKMLFISEKRANVLLLSSITDEDKLLTEAESNLRFRVIRASGFPGPMVMSVGLFHGGSDNQFFLTVFGEVDGKIVRLNDNPLFANIQGGYYLGYLNKNLGYGLAVWTFIWGNAINESHYSEHKYQIEIYQLRGRRLQRTLRRISRRVYDWDKGANSLRELGIRVTDQRTGIPGINESLE